MLQCSLHHQFNSPPVSSTGLQAERGGLAEDHPRTIVGHQTARGPQDVAQVCQPLSEVWQDGKVIPFSFVVTKVL